MRCIDTLNIKKRLLTAIILVLPSAAIFAQQGDSGVSMYGRVDTSYIHQSGRGDAGAQSVIGSGALQPSQIGFRGKEDLGNGVAALFDLQSTILSDTGALASSARFFDRTAMVGLSSTSLGTLTVGRQVTPLADLFYATDPLKAGSGATNMNVRFGYLGGAGSKVAGNFGSDAAIVGNNLDRQDNSVKYAYRNQNGFVAATMYAFGESTNGISSSNSGGVLLGLDRGSFVLRGAAMQFHDINGVPFNAFALGAGFQLGSAVTLKLTMTKNKINSDLAAYGNQATKVYSAGVSWVAMQNMTVTAAYYYGARSADGTVNQIAKKFYIVPEYRVSKRTSIYALLDFERFNATGSQLDTGTPLPAGTGASNYLAIGIGHNF